MSTKYNGFKNYETWVCNMFLNDNQNIQMHWQERARAAFEYVKDEEDVAVTNLFTQSELARIVLADDLKETFNNDAPDIAFPFSDLLMAALGEVNWLELADNLLEGTEGYKPL